MSMLGMHTPLETQLYKSYTIALYRDPDPRDPRQDANLGHMICWHSRYTFGDKPPSASPEQFDECLRIGEQSRHNIQLATIDYPESFLHEMQETPLPKTDVERFVDTLDPAGTPKGVFLPLHLYDHSGITMRTTPFSCRWDSGQVGWIYVDRATILAEYGGRRLTPALRKQVAQVLESESEAYDRYLRGDIVGYQVINGNNQVLDNCWGFDDPAYALQEAQGVIASWRAHRRRRRRNRSRVEILTQRTR